MEQSRTAASHANVHALAAELGLSDAAYRRALEIAQLTPSNAEWLRYINHFLTAVGALLIVAGVTAFFAWNWAELSYVRKFALIQSGIVGSVVLAWRLGIDSIGGRSSFFAAAFLVGVLLAVFGQVYQTGADPYGLFLGWAVLILPWVIIGRQAGLWLLFQVLMNLACIMYWTQVLYPPNGWWQLAQLLGPLAWLSTTMMDSRLASLLFVMNTSALLVWEYAARRGVTWMQGRWFPRVMAFGAFSTVLIPTLFIIFAASFGKRPGLSFLSPILYIAAMASCLYYYQYRKLDLFILTFCVLGAIMVITSLFVRFMFKDISGALILAFLLIGQVAGAAYWLRDVSRRWEAAS